MIPLLYAEALRTAGQGNGAVVRADQAIESAEGAELAVRGAFDPVLTASAGYAHLAFQDIRDALPLTGDDHSWLVGSSLTGITSTGTSYTLSLGLARERSYASGLQPLYDQDGDQIGTAPFEANLVAFSSSMNVTLSQELLRGAWLAYNLQGVHLANQSRTTAELTAQQLRQQAMADAALAYWTWVYHHQVHEMDTSTVLSARESLRAAREQIAARQLAEVEGSRLEAELALAEAAELSSAVLVRQTRDQLLVMMGEQPGRELVPATEPGDPPATPFDPATVSQIALQENLELAVARSVADGQELVRKAARHARLPSLQALASAGRTTGNQLTLGDSVFGLAGDDGQPSVSVGGLLTVPLRNQTARGAVRTAEADLLAAQSTVEELERMVLAQVQYQLAQLESARQRVGLADNGVRAAQQTLLSIEALAEVQRAVPRDVLEARALLARARVEAIRARTDWRLAYTELARLQARLTEEMP